MAICCFWRRTTTDGFGEWSEPSVVSGIAAPNVSALFAQTGYGTGGLISAARSENGHVPFLMADITDERTATAALRLAEIGGDAGVLASGETFAIRQKGRTLDVEIRLAALTKSELNDTSRSWLVVVPAQKSRALKIRLSGGEPITASAGWLEPNGSFSPLKARTTIASSICDAFSSEDHGTLHATLTLDAEPTDLQPDSAWAETYSGDRLIDMAPFQPETAARLTRDPSLITRMYKRMV
jgi:hypothetical protein